MIKHTIAALALTLSLAASAVQAQDTNCDGWMSSDWELTEPFWEVATPETVSVCLNSGLSVNARGEFGATPLHYAADNENSEVLTLLLDAGTDVNARNQFGLTPLHYAAKNENPEVLTVLLDAGADVNARDNNGSTSLHNAAKSHENPETIKTLLNAGADGTAVNDDGETPFDLAQENEALAGTDAYWALNDARYK